MRSRRAAFGVVSSVLALSLGLGLGAVPAHAGQAAATAAARAPADARDALDPTLVARTVEGLAAVVEREYFSPAEALRVASALRHGLAAGRYARPGSPQALAEALTRDLLSLTADKHLAVAVRRPLAAEAPTSDADRALRARRENHGVRAAEILDGNVGYLDVTAFYRPEEARRTIASALALLRHADALVLDLRENGGGSPGTVALLATDLFDAPGLPLFEIVSRSGEASGYATEPLAVVERNGIRPVFVLTSARTFSGGEGLAFLLQERRRAEVIGERTAGAANPGRPFPLDEVFEVTVPTGRVRSAVGGGNWEGAGVVPDVLVQATDALRVAHTRALRMLFDSQRPGPWRESLAAALAAAEARR